MDAIIKAERELFVYESEIFDRMRKIAGKLNTRVVEPIVRYWLVDGKTGKIKQRRERHSHSYVRNEFVRTTAAVPFQIEGTLYADGHLRLWRVVDVVYATDPVGQSATAEGINEGYYANVDIDSHGVVVGRDATAEDFDDFEMGNLVTDGAGPNQFEYLLTVKAEAWNGGSSYYSSTWTRGFDNDSGAGVTIYEVGLIYAEDVGGSNFLISRDIDAGGVLVPNGDRLFVEYEIRTSFP